MTLKEFLISLNAGGIQVFLDGGKLKTKSPPGAITEDIANMIREHKDALIRLLSSVAPQTQDAPIVPVSDADRGTLSFAQQRLWFLDQFGNGSAQYNMPAMLSLTGTLNRQALQTTLDEIVLRHEVLRTTYRKTSTGGVQQVAPASPVDVSFVDVSNVRGDEQQARIDALMSREVSTPFDLAHDLMIRVTLARLSADSHILFLTLHHIAADGWSQGILIREFVALYRAFVEGSEPSLPKLPIQYADYAHWQRQAMSSEPMQHHLSFWREELAGVAQLHNLPTDRLRSPQMETAGQSFRCIVDAQLLESLNALANRQGASLFMVLHAAFALLLCRWSGDEDIVVGTPVAGRERKETEGLIGCFINTLVLRTRCRPGMSFEQFLVQSKASTLHAYEHQQVPFEMVVEDLNPPRSLSHSPLFQVMLAFQNYELGALQLPGLSVEELLVEAQNTKYDITIIAIEAQGSLRMLWTYVEGLFEPSTIESMVSSYLNLLRAIVVDPGQDIHRLPLLTAEQAASIEAAARRGHGALVRDTLGALQPQGAAGLICRARPEPSADDTGWRETGDIGYLRSDGEIQVLRRSDDTQTINGHHVVTRYVEAALRETGLVDAVVVRMQQHAGVSALVAYVVPGQEGHEGLVESCRNVLRTRVPDVMLPALFVAMEALPRLPDGAVDVAGLPVPEFPVTTKAQPVPPSHALEKQLCEIWCSVLQLESVGIHDSFFDVGGTSLHSIIVQQEILDRTGQQIDVTDLFTYPTIAGLAKYMQDIGRPEAAIGQNGRAYSGGDIAVIGMSGRFPDARNVDAFWENIKQGLESLTVFSEEELLAAGVSPAQLADPNYVRSGVVLEGLREFDAAYFGFTPREAEVMDPQQRLLFECAVEALDQAGYGDDGAVRSVGVYLGTGESQYLFENLLPQSALLESMRLAAMHGNRPDYAATRLSYRLNLSGPSVNIGTACSTSLVAVHEACQSLLSGECEMALAGGVSIAQLGPRGYLNQEGFITSADGHCRTFDKDAAGTRSGSGAGLVLLKRLEDALADGDTIHAIIKGSAINNDGADKVGYTAPSVLGQARVIALAHAKAAVPADSIGYVEAHGTGTSLGDPIEVRALARSFGGVSKQSCALGAVKPNIGHLDSAAGVAGLIKTVKVLSERQIPPTINFHQPNPQIDFANSPFYVNTELKDWLSDGAPRRAGVSSFGIGGTNAHVVLEEAPAIEAGQSRRRHQLIVLSAKTPTALARMSSNLAEWMAGRDDEALPDIAHTLHVGRAAYGHRMALVADSVAGAARALADSSRAGVLTGNGEYTDRASVVFMFTGQGSQYLGMGAGLYRSEPLFRDTVDACVERLAPTLGLDLREILFADGDDQQAQQALAGTDLAQPALFVFEYALARLLMSWGVQPEAMIGHSLGEIVAACLSGVFSLDDALKLVAARGRLMQTAESGSMLSVGLDEEAAGALALEWSCELAAVNGPRDCVISGSDASIAAITALLAQREVSCRPLRTSHAFHSRMMADAAVQFGEIVRSVQRHPPTLPYISNVTGRFVEPDQAMDPQYWVAHLLSTVRFADGIQALVSDHTLLRPKRLFLEVGPGIALTSLLRKQVRTPQVVAIECGRHIQNERHDEAVLMAALGQLWVNGGVVDWRGFHSGERCRRVPLPTYPFERLEYWIERASGAALPGVVGKAVSTQDWFHAPVWAQVPAPATSAADNDALWLIFADQGGLAEQLRSRLADRGSDAVTVARGMAFTEQGEAVYAIDPGAEQDYRRLIEALAARNPKCLRILYLWSIDGVNAAEASLRAEQAEAIAFGSLLYLARTCDAVLPQTEVWLDVVTRNVFSVTGDEAMVPESAMALGLCKVIAQEYPQFHTAHIDLGGPVAGAEDTGRVAAQLLAECAAPERPQHAAYRGRKRWLLRYERLPLADTQRVKIRKGGTYLLTGGLGMIGLHLAQELARQGAGAVVLVGRSELPPRDSWVAMCAGAPSATTATLQTLLAIESLGTKVSVQRADVASLEQMQRVIDETERAFGAIHGVIHGAGKVHHALRPLEGIDHQARREQFLPKVQGTQVLDRVLAGRELDFCLLMSSLAAVLGGLGFGAYAAANSYLDAYAQWKHHCGETAWRAVNWDGWLFNDALAAVDRYSMTVQEGLAAFDLILGAAPMPQIVNSTGDLADRSEKWLQAAQQTQTLASDHARPAIQTTFQEPRNAQEKRLVGIWQELLGFTEIGVNDNFFELGGDSVLITKVLGKIRSQPEFSGVDLKIKHLFETPTVAQISVLVDELRQNAELTTKSESLRARGNVVEMGEI